MKFTLPMTYKVRSFLILGCTLMSSLAWAAEKEAPKQITILQTLASGGYMMYALLALSIITLALVLHCFTTVRSSSLIPTSFVDDAKLLLKRGDFSRAEVIAEGARHLGRDLLLAVVGSQGKSHSKVEEAIQNAGSRGIARVHQRITYLSNVGAIAPMCGLLGTVIGLIQAFNTIAVESESAKSIMLAGDIRKALVTTAGGLLVGIPAMGFYFYFRGKLTQVTADLEVAGEQLANSLEERSERDSAS